MSTFSGSSDDVLVSVIVPVYNVEHYIIRCIKSIADQSYRNIEVICVDDGSDDRSLELLQEFAQTDDRIVVLQNSHKGSGAARKKAAKHVRGEYVTCVDSDDWIEPNMYEDMVKVASEYDVDVVATGFIRDYGSHKVTENEHLRAGFYSSESMDEFRNDLVDYDHFARFNVSPSLCNKLFRREVIVPFLMTIPENILTDTDTVCSYPALWKAQNAYVLDRSYYHYCQNVGSVMHNTRTDRRESILNAYSYLNQVASRFESVVGNARRQCDYLEIYAWCNFHPAQLFTYKDSELFGYGNVKKTDRVILYGAGPFGRHLYKHLKDTTDINIIAWADREGDGHEIITPEQMMRLVFDKVMIGVLLYEVVLNIEQSLLSLGVPAESILRIRV